MEKRLTIEGMTCQTCVNLVEDALNRIEGVDASADIQGADVSLNKSITDSALKRAVEEAGFSVVEIKDTIAKA